MWLAWLATKNIFLMKISKKTKKEEKSNMLSSLLQVSDSLFLLLLADWKLSPQAVAFTIPRFINYPSLLLLWNKTQHPVYAFVGLCIDMCDSVSTAPVCVLACRCSSSLRVKRFPQKTQLQTKGLSPVCSLTWALSSDVFLKVFSQPGTWQMCFLFPTSPGLQCTHTLSEPCSCSDVNLKFAPYSTDFNK